MHRIGCTTKPSSIIPLCLSDPYKQSLISDIIATPWSILFSLLHPKYIFFILQLLLFKTNRVHKLSIFRSIWRKLAVYQLLTNLNKSDFVFIVDEGIFHVAHNLLVSDITFPSDKDIKLFSRLTPTFDLTLFFQAPIHILTTRESYRSDPSPRSNTYDAKNIFLQNSKHVFDMLFIHMLNYKSNVKLVFTHQHA